MTITADEINFMLRRFLQEAGFRHTAYVFENECCVDGANIQVSLPPMALVTILKKGMLYAQIEKSINERAKTTDAPENVVAAIMDSVRREEPASPVKPPRAPVKHAFHHSVRQAMIQNKPPPPHARVPPPPPPAPPAPPAPPPVHAKHVSHPAAMPMPIVPVHMVLPVPVPVLSKMAVPIRPMPLVSTPTVITNTNVLRGHSSDVYCCAWTKDGKTLATGGGDATVVIWEMQDNVFVQKYILDHRPQIETTEKDIAALEWSPDSTMLATGCLDGTARIWTINGMLRFVMRYQTQSIYSVSFSPSGGFLLTGSSDGQVVVWNTLNGEMCLTLAPHKARVLDIQWLSDTTFASASGDRSIVIGEVGSPVVKYTLLGHTGDVNEIEWQPGTGLLASCSDDTTVRIWLPFKRQTIGILRGHTRQVYTIRWAAGHRILASGAFDNTIRLWDVLNCGCVSVIANHQENIYTLSFSPRGDFFVSGGVESCMHVWRTCDSANVATCQTGGVIFEANWNSTGSSIALCLSDSTVVIVDSKDIPAYANAT